MWQADRVELVDTAATLIIWNNDPPIKYPAQSCSDGQDLSIKIKHKINLKIDLYKFNLHRTMLMVMARSLQLE